MADHMDIDGHGIVTLSLNFNEEQLQGKGEDSALRITYTRNAALIASMDGCGGAGSMLYSKENYDSGARIASRHVGQALARWFTEKGYGIEGTGGKTADQLAAEMKAAIDAELHRVNDEIGYEATGIQSRLARIFPTTLAGVLAEVTGDDTVRCVFFWAGDSRAFLFPTSGLQQMTRDDIRGKADPFISLEEDSRLTNLVCFDRDYTIHTREMTVTEPCILLSSTDGCFSYFRSPMEFEWFLLDTMRCSETPLQWEQTLKSVFGGFAADDYTMDLVVLGFRNWEAIRTAYDRRWSEFKYTYHLPLQEILEKQDREAHLALWNKYKEHYLPEIPEDRRQ